MTKLEIPYFAIELARLVDLLKTLKYEANYYAGLRNGEFFIVPCHYRLNLIPCELHKTAKKTVRLNRCVVLKDFSENLTVEKTGEIYKRDVGDDFAIFSQESSQSDCFGMNSRQLIDLLSNTVLSESGIVKELSFISFVK